jgi:hypothetical protein
MRNTKKQAVIELGDVVKSRITGHSGVVICMAYWVFGCVRVSYQPQEHKGGKPAEYFTVDLQELVLVKKGVVASSQLAAGVTPPAGYRSDCPAVMDSKRALDERRR